MPGDEETMSDEAIWETLPVSFKYDSLHMANIQALYA